MTVGLLQHIKNGTFLTHLRERTLESWYSNSERNVFAKQEQLLSRTLKYAVRHCPYYQRLFQHSVPDLSQFPIISKDDIRSQYDDFISDVIHRYQYTTSYTGGTSGDPFKILLTQIPMCLETKRWHTLYGYQPGDIVLAMDGTAVPPERIANGQYLFTKASHAIPYGSHGLSSLYLTDENAPSYCKAIAQLKPQFIRGYPSFVFAIACYARQFGINIGDSVKGIELTSEMAYPHQIETIQQVFGKSNVFLQYGHTEGCVSAYTFDSSFRFRVEPLYGYVEVLNANGHHVDVGEMGEVVVTTLHNKALPLIRYRTGDYAEYGGKDERYMYLNKVLGRTQDYIIDGQGNRVLLTALIFAQHFQSMAHIRKWQLEQFQQGVVVVRILPTELWTDNDEQEIATLFHRLGRVECQFRYNEPISLTPRGKSKMLIQHLQV